MKTTKTPHSIFWNFAILLSAAKTFLKLSHIIADNIFQSLSLRG